MIECPYCRKQFETNIELEKHLQDYAKNGGSGEQLKHRHLKFVAKDFLRELGFQEGEIKEEYTLHTTEMREKIRVDVVGLKPSKKVAIECGQVSGQKVAQLNLFFDEVICLPYMNDRISHGSCSEALRGRIRELESELKVAKEQIVKLERERDINKIRQDDGKILFGKSVVLGLYKTGCLPTAFLHYNFESVIRDFEVELQARQLPTFAQNTIIDSKNSHSQAVGLDARV